VKIVVISAKTGKRENRKFFPLPFGYATDDFEARTQQKHYLDTYISVVLARIEASALREGGNIALKLVGLSWAHQPLI
jgi:hypothetical protein